MVEIKSCCWASIIRGEDNDAILQDLLLVQSFYNLPNTLIKLVKHSRELSSVFIFDITMSVNGILRSLERGVGVC